MYNPIAVTPAQAEAKDWLRRPRVSWALWSAGLATHAISLVLMREILLISRSGATQFIVEATTASTVVGATQIVGSSFAVVQWGRACPGVSHSGWGTRRRESSDSVHGSGAP